MSTESGAVSAVKRERERILRLDFECLRSLPEGINEVRLWWDPLLRCHRVGKRIDISAIEHDDALPEPATLQMIDHPNVLKVVAAARIDGYPSPMQVVELVTPYLPRGSITDALFRGEKFVASEGVAIVQAALRGIAELHEVHAVAHRDVKSGNILLADDHTVAKVADMGLAGLFNDSGEAPALNNPTLYSPPELVQSGILTRSSDLYPLALVLRELLGGAFPYPDYPMSAVQGRLLRGLSPVRNCDLALPIWTSRSIRRIINKASSRVPAQRFQTAREMDDALAAAAVVDWTATDEGRWEAPFVHRGGLAIRVEATEKRTGSVLQTKVNRGQGWRRAAPDMTVPRLDSAATRRVFDHATDIATAR